MPACALIVESAISGRACDCTWSWSPADGAPALLVLKGQPLTTISRALLASGCPWRVGSSPLTRATAREARDVYLVRHDAVLHIHGNRFLQRMRRRVGVQAKEPANSTKQGMRGLRLPQHKQCSCCALRSCCAATQLPQ